MWTGVKPTCTISTWWHHCAYFELLIYIFVCQTCADNTRSRVRFLVAMYLMLAMFRLATAISPPLFVMVVVVEPWLFIIAGI